MIERMLPVVGSWLILNAVAVVAVHPSSHVSPFHYREEYGKKKLERVDHATLTRSLKYSTVLEVVAYVDRDPG
jgi:hypothetical protein